jgi:hypothetical protein
MITVHGQAGWLLWVKDDIMLSDPGTEIWGLKRSKPMTKRTILFGLILAVGYLGVASAQYPIMDAIANKVIQKYTSSTCEQLWVKKEQKMPPTAQEQKAIAMLKADPQMRTAFINKIAAPIANKMFDCGMIP